MMSKFSDLGICQADIDKLFMNRQFAQWYDAYCKRGLSPEDAFLAAFGRYQKWVFSEPRSTQNVRLQHRGKNLARDFAKGSIAGSVLSWILFS
jgi:hypothetical protein